MDSPRSPAGKQPATRQPFGDTDSLRRAKDQLESAIWLVDLDDTVIDTAGGHISAAESMTEALTDIVGTSDASRVVRQFKSIFQILLEFHQSDEDSHGAKDPHLRRRHREILQQIDYYQRKIAREWGLTKKFSREVLLKVAIDRCTVELTSAQLKLCADIYWKHLAENVEFFPDALRFVNSLGSSGSLVYLITSSDARFSLHDDTNQFNYDPRASRNFKKSRLALLQERGLRYRGAIIGDPLDKPSEAYFDLAYARVSDDLEQSLDLQRVVVVGDSFESDLRTPLAQKIGLGILYVRGQPDARIEGDRVLSIGNFDTLRAQLDRIPSGAAAAVGKLRGAGGR